MSTPRPRWPTRCASWSRSASRRMSSRSSMASAASEECRSTSTGSEQTSRSRLHRRCSQGPPGAVLLASSDRALDYMAKRERPIESYYMNLLRWKPVMEDPRVYLATPATQVLLGLKEALLKVKEETLEKRW